MDTVTKRFLAAFAPNKAEVAREIDRKPSFLHNLSSGTQDAGEETRRALVAWGESRVPLLLSVLAELRATLPDEPPRATTAPPLTPEKGLLDQVEQQEERGAGGGRAKGRKRHQNKEEG